MSVALSAAKVPVRMTVREFLDWGDLTPGRWELVDGEPRAMTPPLRTHGALLVELARLLANWFEASGRRCFPIADGGVLPGLLSDYNMRMADLVVTCTGYTQEERAISEPVLIVEILSPSNRAETWSNVWTYVTIASVREILVLHGDTIRAEVLRRNPDGTWPQRPHAITEGDLVLGSVGFSAPLVALYRTTRLSQEG